MAVVPMPIDGMPPKELALWYTQVLNWRIVPCKGKRPIISGAFNRGSTDAETIEAWWERTRNANIGLALGQGLWCLDVDTRNGGDQTLRALEKIHGELPPTVTSVTGSRDGSVHLIWVEPTPNSIPNTTLGDGLDVLGHGKGIILPRSIHPKSGKHYEWESDRSPDDMEPQQAPAWLIELVMRGAQPTAKAAPGPATAPNGPRPIIPEGRRHNYLWPILRDMSRAGASIPALALQAAYENECFDPPYTQQELDAEVQGALRSWPSMYVQTGNGTLFAQVPPTVGQPSRGANDTSPPESWRAIHLDPYTNVKTGEIKANNTTLMAMLEYHHDWRGRLWWDDMASKLMLDTAELTDASITQVGAELGYKYHLPVHSDALLQRCLLAVCQQHKRDPLQHWLHGLDGWDGEKRLETWLLDCAGLTDTAYHRFCSRNLIVSMIARAFDPGCICRSVLILEGPEEYRKSTFVLSLAPKQEWVDEISASLDGKEAHMLVQGLWVAELGELASLGRTEEARLKSFISLRVDAFIPKFKSFRVQNRRRTIFVGTTNKDVYFKDTGNTRFLPVRVMQSMDIESFIAIREKLFAEAMLYYNDNPDQWWRMDAEATAQAAVQREQRRQTSWIEDELGEWLKHRPTPNRTSWSEIAKGFYGLDSREKWSDINRQRQTSDALRALGWEQNVRWCPIEKKTVRCWEHNPLTDEA